MDGMTKTEAVLYAAEHGHRYVVYVPEDYSWATVEDADDLETAVKLWGVSRVEALSPERWVTNAPEAYDYGYTYTVGEVEMHGTTMRVLAVTDPARFERYQFMRYASGLYNCIRYDGGAA